ncbi:MAG: sodium:solute symporter family protein [Chlorobium phaeovibrioides]|nr:sodium:solute symporter family protein [Chlorobium phaeovibrioides]
MQNTIVIVYLFTVLVVGILAGRKITGLKEYAVAGKSFGAMVIFATLSASFIGGGFSMGNAEKVFLIGIANIVALWGFSLKEILVALYIAPRMKKYPDAISIGDIMEPHYGKGARIFSGLFGVALCAGILGAQVGAMGYIFNLFLGIDRTSGILIGCSIVIAYATIGGMRSVIWTDVMQFIVLSVGIPLTLFYGIQFAGGWESMIQRIPPAHLQLPSSPGAIAALVSLFLTFVLGETLVPPYVQRLLIGKTDRDVARGTLFSGLFSIPFFAVTGLIGIVALSLDPGINPNLALPFVVQASLHPVLQGIVIAAIISIIMSSADSFLNGAAIAFSNDLVAPLRRTPLAPSSELFLARATTLVVGVAAVVFALSIESVLDILIYAYNFWAPTVVVPLGAAILGFRATKSRFIGGAIAGIAAALLWSSVLHAPYGIEGLVMGCFANLTVFFLIPADRETEEG